MQALSSSIHHLSALPARHEPDMSLDAWISHCMHLESAWPDPAARALVAGFDAPCVAYAFAGGYQAALGRMLGSGPRPCFRALCVTEQGGNRPRHMQTTLTRSDAGWCLNGEKSYVTGGTHAEELYVAARRVPEGDIVMLRVPLAREGVVIQPLAELPFVPELPHAAVKLSDVHVCDQELMPGDGYDNYVKPFRTIEDIHVELALIGHMWRQTANSGDHPVLLQALAAHAATLFALAALAPQDPVAHLALAGHREHLRATVTTLESVWETANPRFHALWLRDRKLLGVAGAARDTRTQRAWERLRESR